MSEQYETQFSERTISAAESFLELTAEEKGDWIRLMDEVLTIRSCRSPDELAGSSSSAS